MVMVRVCTVLTLNHAVCSSSQLHSHHSVFSEEEQYARPHSSASLSHVSGARGQDKSEFDNCCLFVGSHFSIPHEILSTNKHRAI